MTDEQIKQKAIEIYRTDYYAPEKAAFERGAKHYRDNDQTMKQLKKLRNDIEKTNSKLDLVHDSELIQCYGSIIGRLNLILNQ